MGRTVSFSERQQQCLEAMGVVPWISRNPELDAVLGNSAEPAVDSTRSSVADQPSVPPSDLHELGLWLPEQPLAEFGYKGAMHTTLGHPEASVLVVVEGPSDGELPLAGDAAQLFELMMSSIGLGRSDVRQCALISNENNAQSARSVGQTLNDACTPQTRAILILLVMSDSDDLNADGHHCRLMPSQLPAWRIVHPDILLKQNLRKRQAWQALKALQQYLVA